MKYCRKEDVVFYHTVMMITKTKTNTKTKCKEDPKYTIFLKSREFKDTKYDRTGPDQDRSGQNRTDQDRTGQNREDQRRLQSCRPNSRTCVLVLNGFAASPTGPHV